MLRRLCANICFDKQNLSTDSPKDVLKEKSVPQLLLVLVSMVLEGPSINDHIVDATTPAALAIAQMLKFNSIKHKRTQHAQGPALSVRHSVAQETPVPIYIGLMLHTHTRKRELIDKMAHLGMSISYDRVLRLSTQMGNKVCEQFHHEQVVCPPKLRANVFTTAAVDNIDHNPSSATAKESFHGTAISLFQHPSFAGEGLSQGTAIVGGSGDTNSRTLNHLPHYYTEVPPVASSMMKPPVPEARVVSLDRDGFKGQTEEEYLWLDNARQVTEDTARSEDSENTSWAAFHANRQPPQMVHVMCPTALLPLFQESAHTVAMIRHAMDVVQNAVGHLNPKQTPVLAVDQPLFALAKQIQWKWPQKYGEDKLVVMFGGLHIEMAALKMLGNWLEGSGWVQALTQADVATSGIAESFLKAAHVRQLFRI